MRSQLRKKETEPEEKKLHQNQDTISEMKTPTKSSKTNNKRIINKNDYSDKNTVPTPFKQLETPFKNAFYFPKKEEKPLKKKVYKKVTPTVATAQEFMEHQRRIESEKAEKERIKQQKKQVALKKKEERDLIIKNKKNRQKNIVGERKTKENKKKVTKHKRILSPKPSTSFDLSTHCTPDKVDIFTAKNNNNSHSDDSRNEYTNIDRSVKRLWAVDTGSDDSSS